jgi:hypothetical protein
VSSTSELLLAWDQRRPRSQQRRFGMSELGGCRRRAGYRLAGTEPTDAGGSVQAVMGTAIHDAIAAVLAETAEPGDLVEQEVEFAGILGHFDRYEAATRTLKDVKTTSSRWLQHIKVHGPSRDHLWQVNGYAAALINTGTDVRTVQIDYIARDTGEEWSWSGRFDPVAVREALAWVAEVRSTELDMLPRDYEPGSAFCDHCPFRTPCWGGAIEGRDERTVLYLADPDGAKWAQQLWQARQDKADAERREKEARGALDALRPNDEGTVTVDVGWKRPLVFQVKRGARRLDTDAVKQEYKKAGAEPPYKQGNPTVSVDFGEPVQADETLEAAS